ncbi:helix-turn-helix domain-containing protein [Haladaptatus paucihalophilus]|nr:helix-turn-helix domain-containing protein [Haladaptatus paucihalophilus]
MTILIDPGGSNLVSVFDSVKNESVTRESLHHFNVLIDGTVVLLYQLRGDLDHARTIFNESSDVFQYDVPDHGDGLVYLHCKLDDPLKSLLSNLQTAEVIIDMPIVFQRDGRLRITFIGEPELLRRVLDGTEELVDTELERTGRYQLESRRLRSLLTDRQREILIVAVEQGYYTVPRQASIREIADDVDLSVATVAEHLQKIEARVLSQVAQ